VGLFGSETRLKEKVNYGSQSGESKVRFLADFKKRNTERKGGKKEEIKSKKLMEDNLDDLRGRGEESR
jgi:hypothetical protein